MSPQGSGNCSDMGILHWACLFSGSSVENFELQLETLGMVLETEDVPLKRKISSFLTQMTASTIIYFSLLPVQEFPWDVIRTSIRTMTTFVLLLAWITNYQSADVGQARKHLWILDFCKKWRSLVVVTLSLGSHSMLSPHFVSPMMTFFCLGFRACWILSENLTAVATDHWYFLWPSICYSKINLTSETYLSNTKPENKMKDTKTTYWQLFLKARSVGWLLDLPKG